MCQLQVKRFSDTKQDVPEEWAGLCTGPGQWGQDRESHGLRAMTSLKLNSVPCPRRRVRHRTAASRSSRILQPGRRPRALVPANVWAGSSGSEPCVWEEVSTPLRRTLNTAEGWDEVTAIRVQSAPRGLDSRRNTSYGIRRDHRRVWAPVQVPDDCQLSTSSTVFREARGQLRCMNCCRSPSYGSDQPERPTCQCSLLACCWEGAGFTPSQHCLLLELRRGEKMEENKENTMDRKRLY